MSRSGRNIAVNRRGMSAFLVVWSGQFVSTIGTLMTSLALAFWAFDVTGRATELGLMVFFTFGPRVLLGPFAGAWVDRCKRRTVLIACDLLAGAGSIAILLLFVSGNLAIWHMYVLTALMSAFAAFQGPAFIASATMMVDKRHHGRVNGLMTLNVNASAVIAPALAGLMLPFVGLTGVLVLDVATFLFATGALLVIRIPEPVRTTIEASTHPMRRILHDMHEGFRFLRSVRALLALQLAAAAANLFGTFYDVLLRPFVLLRTGDNEIALASVQSAIGIGGAAAALAVALWGGPKRHRTLFGMVLFALAFLLRGIAGANLTVAWIAALGLAQSALLALAGSTIRTIWQAKIPPQFLGRVFSSLATISGLLMLLTMLLGGPLADRVFEPALRSDPWMRGAFGPLVGTDAGSGIGLMLLVGGASAAAICAGSLFFRRIRQIETSIPDYDEGRESASS